MNMGKTYTQYEKEESKMKDFNHRMLIGRKYFKTKSPNFLTFAEKEQIRKFHEDDPDRYTIDELSKAFPADPQTISIIVRGRWQPRDTIKLQKHDEAVKRNWEAFKEGKLTIDPLLAEHLKKFAFRDFNSLAKPQPYRRLGVQVPKPRGNEFLSIITSCKKYADESEENKIVTSGRPLRVRKIESEETRIPEMRPIDDEDDTYVLQGKKEYGKKMMTLEELQKIAPQFSLQKDEEKEVTFEEHVPKFKEIKLPSERKSALSEFKDEVGITNDVRPFIKIPKEVWKRGQLYKHKDCFYSDDGEFLYRVPGLE